MKKEIKPKIIQSPKPEEFVELDILASEIVKLSNAAQSLNNSRLKKRAIVLLLKDMCNMPMRDIEVVLHNLPLLAKEFLK